MLQIGRVFVHTLCFDGATGTGAADAVDDAAGTAPNDAVDGAACSRYWSS